MEMLLPSSFILNSLQVQGSKKKKKVFMKKVKYCPENVFWCFGLRWPPNQELIASSSFTIPMHWGKL